MIDAITAAGTVVVFSAGNDGPAGGTVGCPGCVENAVTVAASTTDRIFANQGRYYRSRNCACGPDRSGGFARLWPEIGR